jgi:hypothetical protein
MSDFRSPTAARIVHEFLSRAGVEVFKIEERPYVGERNYVTYVASEDFAAAVAVTEDIESLIRDSDEFAFLVVRRADSTMIGSVASTDSVQGVHDPRADEFVRLVSARSRVSNAEPSLVYVEDVRASLAAVTAARHHLIFGRRGAGKTALLVEAKRQLEGEFAITSWTNMQTLRRESPQRVFLHVVASMLASVIATRAGLSERSFSTLELSEVYGRVQTLLDAPSNTMDEANRLIPRIQGALARYLSLTGIHQYVFLDDFYYIARSDQPLVLDMLHGCVRDADAWLKIASIKHLTNWWQSQPPTGLQTGQDAAIIDLDVTLQDPQRAQQFLEGVIFEYARRVGISSIGRLFSRAALDRLVLASGAVPRDYLVLSSSAIGRAQQRAKASKVGVQDVNQAAGDAASAKLQELEEDMAANVGAAEQTVLTLNRVREFCLEEKAFTYFLVDHREKEKKPREYSLLTELMDVRLIHLIDAGVSDSHSAGQRYEAFMLDLSQFSGSRLKHNIQVLDFVGGKFESRKTGEAAKARKGATSRQLIAILRAAPTLELDTLSSQADISQSIS